MGLGTANKAVAAETDFLYVANVGKKLLRFRWKPGDLDSARFVDEVDTKAEAVGLTARGDRVVVVYKDEVEVRKADDLSVVVGFKLQGARDAALDPAGSLWVLAGDAVRRYSADGKEQGAAVPGLEKPSAVALDRRDGRLIVCEDGRRQQVLFYDVTAEPKRVAVFGDEGGLYGGTPGRVTPAKLFSLRGAGTDADGNLYVAMSFGDGPSGGLFLRSFTPAGEPRWELTSAAFVDCFGFDPDADGAVVYGRTARFDLDLSQTKPGAEARLRDVTVDHLHHADDDRLKYGGSVLVRNLKGRRLLYTIGQYAGGYRLYTFDGADGGIASAMDRIGGDDKWAWDVDAEGAVWHGDADGRTIRRYRFKGWKDDGKPDYDWKNYDHWPWPDDFELVRRVVYVKATDTLYLFGYLKGEKIESWGVVGPTAPATTVGRTASRPCAGRRRFPPTRRGATTASRSPRRASPWPGTTCSWAWSSRTTASSTPTSWAPRTASTSARYSRARRWAMRAGRTCRIPSRR